MEMEMQAESEIPVVTEENPKRKLVRTVLDNFSKLSNPHENVRVKSAANLLKYLVENSATEEGSNELNYALKRLVRGLGASTSIARAGYYSLLVALLNSKLEVHPDKILEIAKTELHKSGKNSDGENADIYTGQILACGAIIKANLWNNIGLENKKQILQILLTACKERSYLGLFGFSFIVELLNLVPDIGTDSEFIAQIQNEVGKPWAEQTLDSLYLLIKLRLASPKIFNKKFIKKSLETPEIICEESLEKLCNILMTIPRVTSLKHPIYDVIVDYLNPTILPSFFNELDNHLKTPNRNRLLVFIKILTNTLMQTVKSEEYFSQIAALFTRNFIIQLLGYFRTFKGKQKDKEYHDAVQKLFIKLVELFNKETINSTVKISIIKKLLFDPGTFVFEKVTKSKIVQQITLSLDLQGVNDLALVYRGVADGTETINSENESETWLNNDRLYSAHLLIKLLSLPAMRQESDWKVEQLRFLMEISLLKQWSGMNVGRELAESLKTAFFGALDLKLSKLEDLHLILFKLVQSLDEKINTENLETLLRTPITIDTYELWQKTLKTVKKIEKKQKKSGITSVFLTLFLHMGLQLFNDVKLATDSLNELFSCYERMKKDKKAKHALDDTVPEKSIVESEDDPYWVEVVVDLFLNLLSHNSHLLRSIINSVFPHLCKYMTSSTISQILSVLDSKDDENPLSKNDDASSESEDDENDKSGSEEESDEEENGDVEEEDDDDEESEDDTARGKLRMALHQALSNGTNESDDESIDLDQMSDTEGEKLDKALAEAFRQFRPNHGKRKKQTKDQETLTHFRVRVLDLIEIYLDSNPSMLLALEIMLPLLQAVEFSIRDEHQKPLNDRLKNILKKLLSLKKFTDIEGVTDSVLVDLLKSLLDKGNKNVLIVQEMGEQISDCCIFVVKCSDMLRNVEATPSKTKKHLKNKILEVICGELHQFFTQRDSMTPYVLFKNLLQLTWEGNMGLASILLDFMFSSEIRQFKKNQVAELLKIFYSNQRFFSQYKKNVDSKMVEAHKTFSSNVIEFFKELCEEPDKKHIKERFICNFFTLLSAIKNSPMDQSNISWSEIATNIREYRSFKSFSKDAKMAFNKLCRVLGVSNIVAMKQNVTKLATLIDNEDADDVAPKDEDEKQPKKKQKRKNNETLKLKKEAKELRLNSLSKGLGQVDFEEAVEINVSDIDSSAEESNKRVKDGSDEEKSSHSTKKKKKRKISEQIDGKNIQLNGLMEEGVEESNEQEGHSGNKKKKRKISENTNGEHIELNNSDLIEKHSKESNIQESHSTKKKKKSKTSEQTNGDNVQVNGLEDKMKTIKNKKLLKDGLNMSVNDLSINKKKRVLEGDNLVKGKRKNTM